MHQIGADGIYFVNVDIKKGDVKIRINKVNDGFRMKEYGSQQEMP